MKIEDLMKPRYKVIADWPGVAGKVKAGDVLHVDDEFIDGLYWVGGEQFMEDKLKDYPHLFKKLEWWEGRTVEEMPEYVKCKYDGEEIVAKIESYKENSFGELFGYTEATFTGVLYIKNSSAIPATLSEYILHQKETEGE